VLRQDRREGGSLRQRRNPGSRPKADERVRRLLRRLGRTRKGSVGASEGGEFLRAAWRALIAGELHALWLMFLKDEMASNTSLFSLYAWAPRGRRARCSVSRNRGK
jgi:hypothetical protein